MQCIALTAERLSSVNEFLERQLSEVGTNAHWEESMRVAEAELDARLGSIGEMYAADVSGRTEFFDQTAAGSTGFFDKMRDAQDEHVVTVMKTTEGDRNAAARKHEVRRLEALERMSRHNQAFFVEMAENGEAYAADITDVTAEVHRVMDDVLALQRRAVERRIPSEWLAGEWVRAPTPSLAGGSSRPPSAVSVGSFSRPLTAEDGGVEEQGGADGGGGDDTQGDAGSAGVAGDTADGGGGDDTHGDAGSADVAGDTAASTAAAAAEGVDAGAEEAQKAAAVVAESGDGKAAAVMVDAPVVDASTAEVQPAELLVT